MATSSNEKETMLEEIERLQQEKRTLGLRVQSAEVLAKVLEDSHKENSKLKQEVLELRQELKGLDSLPSRLSLQTTPSMMDNRCFLSQADDNSLSSSVSFEYMNFKTNPSFEAELSSTSGTIPYDLHIRELSSGFKTIKSESDTLLKEAKNLLELTKNVLDKSESTALEHKVCSLINRIGNNAKDVKTRETLVNGLAYEEEQLKEKAMVLEKEQASQKKMMENLKMKIKDDKEELEDIKEQIQLSCETVFVNKEDARSMEENISSGSVTSNISQLSSLSKEKDMEISVTSSSCGSCAELLQQLNRYKKEKEEAVRQKEEILDVNHDWDAQYKKLKIETGKEIADLNQQIEFLKISDPWASVSDMIDQEKQKALEERNKLEKKCEELQEEVYKLSLQNRSQQQRLLINDKIGSTQNGSPSLEVGLTSLTNHNQKLPSISQSAALNEEPSQGMVKEIEILKQQLRVYADDFAYERQDRERMQSEKENMETELKSLREEVALLKEQIHVYKEDFMKESQEKDRLRRELKLQREGSDPESRLNEMTRKAQVVAERQARLRALRDQYNREERHLLQDQQELQQSARVLAIPPESQQPLHDPYPARWDYRQNIQPRGATDRAAPNDMFHGGEVQADSRILGREVIDSATDGLCCPRCYRLFPRDEQDSFKNHKIKCIE